MYFSISLRSCASDVNAVLAVEEFELLQFFTPPGDDPNLVKTRFMRKLTNKFAPQSA